MSRDDSGIFSRYVDTTSPLTWPRSRRKAYITIKDSGISTGYIDKSSLFRQWTIEGPNSCYREINRGLLNDDLDILQKHANYINDLRRAIRENLSRESVKVYRGLQLDPSEIQQIKTNMVFLWPTFSSTSRNRSIAQGFGNYIFEIDASPNDGTYRADIRHYSPYSEEEVLFYPYSGFRVKNIFKDARVIQLECIDTTVVEKLVNSNNSSGQSFAHGGYPQSTGLHSYGLQSSGLNMAQASNIKSSFGQKPPCPRCGHNNQVHLRSDYHDAALDADYTDAAQLAVDFGGTAAQVTPGLVNAADLLNSCYRIIDRIDKGYFEYFVRGYVGSRTRFCIFNLQGSNIQYICNHKH